MDKEIYSFINSELDEAEYYTLSKENLINLKAYLLKLKEVENDFQQQIESEFKSIKSKYDWVDRIDFDGFIIEATEELKSTIRLNAKGGINIIAKFNPDTGRYEELTKEIPSLYFMSRRVRNFAERNQCVKSIQDELRKIDEIGKLMYKKFLTNTSISGNFKIEYSPSFGLYVYNNFDLLAKFLNYPRPKKYDEKEMLNDDEKQKILNKILIKQN